MTANVNNPDLMVSIDPTANYAWLSFLVAMTWPRSLQRRQEALATIGIHAAYDKDAIEAFAAKVKACAAERNRKVA
jgi:hypothetical protein